MTPCILKSSELYDVDAPASAESAPLRVALRLCLSRRRLQALPISGGGRMGVRPPAAVDYEGSSLTAVSVRAREAGVMMEL